VFTLCPVSLGSGYSLKVVGAGVVVMLLLVSLGGRSPFSVGTGFHVRNPLESVRTLCNITFIVILMSSTKPTEAKIAKQTKQNISKASSFSG